MTLKTLEGKFIHTFFDEKKSKKPALASILKTLFDSSRSKRVSKPLVLYIGNVYSESPTVWVFFSFFGRASV